jgi:ATP-dependent RNA helicase SUPV3L1/SUV3
LYSDQLSGYNCLVATDAVGMGLNLSIRRIIFSTLEKFDGKKRRRLWPSVSKFFCAFIAEEDDDGDDDDD